VDLTQRVKPFVSPAGIDIPEAQVPVGHHLFRIEVKDTDGRLSSASLSLKVDAGS
jgi:hypothetical protein